MAASVANGCDVAAAPCTPHTAEREANVAPSTRSPLRTSGRLRLGLAARDGAIEDVLWARVGRRRDRVRAQVEQARSGRHLVPTWLMATVLGLIYQQNSKLANQAGGGAPAKS